MADQIFNRSSDNYVFTGSRLRAGTNNIDARLRLSSANNEAVIDLCNNSNVDISATAVYINGLKVVTTSSGDATALTALHLAENLDVSGTIRTDGGIQIGSGVFGGTITKSSNVHEIIIDPFGIDDSNSTDASGSVVIMGDLIVRGNTTTIYSSNVDISDIVLTLASGSISALKSNNAGIQIGDGYATLLYDSTANVWKTNIGVDISDVLTANSGINYNGNVLPLNNSSKLPVTLNTFGIQKTIGTITQDLLYGDVSANIWMDASGYYVGIQVLSNYSYIKIEVKVAYTASPEADQTLSFRVLRGIDETGQNYGTTPVFTDISLGSSMGVTLNGIYNGTFYDNLNGETFNFNVVYYKLQFRRDCPPDDTISTPFGIRGSTSNYFAIQELYNGQ